MLSDLGSIATILTFAWLVWTDKSKHPALKKFIGRSTIPGWIVVLYLMLYRVATTYFHVDFVVVARGHSIATDVFNFLIAPAGNVVLWVASVLWIVIAALWFKKKDVDQPENAAPTSTESPIVSDPGKSFQQGEEPLPAAATKTARPELDIEYIGTRQVSVFHFPSRRGMLSEKQSDDGRTALGPHRTLVARFRTLDSIQSIVAHIDYAWNSTTLQIDHGLWLDEPRNALDMSPGKTAELVLFGVDSEALYAIDDFRDRRDSAPWQRKPLRPAESYRVKITLVEGFGQQRVFELRVNRSGPQTFLVSVVNS